MDLLLGELGLIKIVYLGLNNLHQVNPKVSACRKNKCLTPSRDCQPNCT